jgi:DNA-binding CsgD family transcriptional regulator
MFDPDPFVDQIYEAALVPELWPEVLDSLCPPSRSIGGVLFAANANFEGWTASPGFADLFRNFVKEGWAARNPRPARGLQLGTRGFIHDFDLFTQEELDSDPTYAYLRRVGGGYFAGLAAPLSTGDMIAISWERSVDVGPFDSGTVASFNALAGHLQRAALIAGRIGLQKVRAAADAMGAIGLPAAVLNHANKLLIANDLFAPLTPAVIQDRGKRVAFADPRADAQFKTILDRLKLGRPSADQIQSLPVAASENRPPMVVHVVPIRRSAADLFSAANCMLVVTALTAGNAVDAALIQGLFDLTPAEARVAQAIGKGAQLTEIARAHSVSVETIRTQLRSIFAKTGVSRQTELALLLSGAAL